MSTYKQIKGFGLQTLTSDPSPILEGQVFVRNTYLNLSQTQIGSWTMSTGLSNARTAAGGCGTQTAALVTGGRVIARDGTQTNSNLTEEFDGSTWVSGGNLGTVRHFIGAVGTQTTALAIGGLGDGPAVVTSVEEYNGTSWTGGGALPASRYHLGAAGTQTSALSIGGVDGATAVAVTTVQEYDGSSWISGGSLPTALSSNQGIGSQTSALSVAGFQGQDNTLEYDGTSWSSGGNLNNLRYEFGASGAGTQTAAVVYGGTTIIIPAVSNKAELYDGTSWTNGANMLINRRYGSNAGTQSAALASGGSSGLFINSVEKWDSSPSNFILGGSFVNQYPETKAG